MNITGPLSGPRCRRRVPLTALGAAVALAAVLTTAVLTTAAVSSAGTAEAAGTAGNGASGVAAGAPRATSQVVTWAASADRQVTPTQDRTYRLVVRTSAGGKGLRIRLSNAFGDQPVTFGRAYAGRRATDAAVVPGTNRALSFGGSPSVTVPAGGSVYSDALPGTVPPQSDLAVSIYVQSAGATASGHRMALQTSFVAPAGDHTAQESAAPFTQRIPSWFYLDAVVVGARHGTGAVAAFGDSITDGASSTQNTNRRWPDLLAGRLAADRTTRIKGVANEGISGNRVLSDGAGQSALKRLDRDVLSQRGLETVILLEGVNDIKSVPAPTAEQLIAGYREIIGRSHAAGVCVVGATVMPYEGWRDWNADGERVRQEVNAFIRDSGSFDAVADFDTETRDPSAPSRMLPAFDSGDHLHPNDAGMDAMSRVVDPDDLRCDRR
ncbi:SGNH/GDSL hydrolase family protein [Streptomyces sp. NBC_00654]|uniref:SGNH/GDSL hydrolase family protein n=1 Tax=Streptomyces sp. NBC_00654 TaxID=2975799 RepID=UPI00224E1597|nr:SGNH/GDSL hydrolase family protein [Streptomyces sp. NBC_00654]MCX4965922.1 SGNH/GDSL hydrolase family protein [Streptomyces sp. NBC_00654]